jgi:hypothetical protein
MPCDIGTFAGFGPNMGTKPWKEKGPGRAGAKGHNSEFNSE